MLRESLTGLLVALPFGLGLTAAGGDRTPPPLLRFADPGIVESSGLVARGGLLQTVNDSGDEARVFTVDLDGRTVGVSRWDAEPVDVEALAPGPPSRVWVGDIGDNTRSRTTVTVTSVPVGKGERSGGARTFRLAHPGGAVDAEALLAHPRTGRLLLVTKSVLGGQVLAAPARLDQDGTNRLRPLGRVMPLVTDGAFLPDGRHVVLRDYSRARVYTFPALEEVGDVPLPAQEQGEGIAVADDGRLLVSSEGVRAPVHAVPLPAAVTRAMAATGPEPNPSGPDPTASPVPPSPEPEPVPPAPVRRDPWPWLLGGGVLVAMTVVLLRSLRPR